MNLMAQIQQKIIDCIQEIFTLTHEQIKPIQISLQVNKTKEFGDLSCNAAMLLAKTVEKSPREIAEKIKPVLLKHKELSPHIKSIEIAGPGFINISLQQKTWQQLTLDLFHDIKSYFKLDNEKLHKKYLIEFVSANPTGPLHLGHGRGGIIGDVLANVLTFLGHKADREYYINDAGSQIEKLGLSLKIRCQQAVGQNVEFPENGYAGDYLLPLAQKCIEHYGPKIIEKEVAFFADYAKDQLLEKIKQTLDAYGIHFDKWFSEKVLYKDNSINKAIDLLRGKDLAYTKDDAVWFNATKFGDDKDRVVKKNDGTYTYIAADIAYHKDKFDRGYDILINVLGQDHHGYVKRLKATMQALEYNSNNLDVILYQLVSITHEGQAVKMSKRAGTFEKLADVIEQVGTDVARFFYLNRKADAHLEFDLNVALKKTEENPVYYIQYAYVRTNSLIIKATEHKELKPFVSSFANIETVVKNIGPAEIAIIKKICSLNSILTSIAHTYQTHLLSYYTLELAKAFHNYYANNKIIDDSNIETTQCRIFITKIVQNSLALCLELLGLSKPNRM